MIDERIEEIHRDKEKLRRDKVQRFLEEKRKAVIAQLDDLLEDVTMRHEELRTSDLGKIRHEKQIVEEVMEDAEDSLVDAWADLIEGVKRNMGADLRDSIKQITKEAKEDIRRAFKQRESAGLLDKFKNLFGDKLDEDLEEGTDGYIQDMSDAIDKQLPDVEDMLGHSFAGKAAKEMLRTFVSELRGQAALKISLRRIKPVLRGTINGILKKARSEIEKLSNREDKFEAKEYPNIQWPRAYQLRALDFVEWFRNLIYELADEAEGKVDKVVEKAPNNLVPLLVENLRKYHDDLERDLKNREAVLKRHHQVLEKLKRHRSGLKKEQS